MGDMLLRLAVTRTGEAQLPQTRQELLGLAAAQQAVTQTTVESRAAVTGWGVQAARAGEASLLASRHAHMLRGALIALAFEATGSAGAVGRLVTGLLFLGGGSAVVIGVAAGVAGIVSGYRLLTRETREAEQRTRELRNRIQELQDARDPTASIRREIQGLTAELVVLSDRWDQLRAQTAAMAQAVTTPPLSRVGVTLEQVRPGLTAAQRSAMISPLAHEMRTLLDTITDLTAQLNKIVGEQGAEAGRRWLQGLRDEIEQADITRLQAIAADLQARILAGGEPARRRLGATALEAMEAAQRAAPRFTAAAPVQFEVPFGLFRGAGQVTPRPPLALPLAESRVGGFLPPVIDTRPFDRFGFSMRRLQLGFHEGAIEVTKVNETFKNLITTMDRSQHAADLLGVHIINAVSGALQAIVSGGGPGGIISGVGGILGLVKGLNPLFGIGVSAFGSIISAAEARGIRIDEYGDRALDQMKQLREGPDVVTISIVSPGTGELLRQLHYDLRRQERLDRQERLPASLGAL